ncbi:MAG: shikimate kinase, partial [Candidatus Firestonebacteria bacterium]|nr:shikimate kinase [Candidatus Firestonebacteria bacterium]
MNIILIGFMGTGKSSIGKLLAKKKNKQFVDIDEEIEKSENLSITEIFNNYGEDYFRDLESKYLQRIIEQKKDCVIACGGGVVLKEKNINLLKKNSVVILLSAETEVIYNIIK